ncbi:hypothetical protein LWI29_016075 [Acer saccharum]|uniref:Uncharacterized protein n=1 Tax=Acer saccharum TaxID=4024 RepID=A0AA39RGS9_ACESA|nr:hypothetical protein LWI29_016075 [Acer saccharum]
MDMNVDMGLGESTTDNNNDLPDDDDDKFDDLFTVAMQELYTDMLKKLNTRVEDATQTSGAINDSATRTENSLATDGQPTARRNVNDGTSNSQATLFMPKTVKIDFPRYDDKSDPTIWLFKAEQFF